MSLVAKSLSAVKWSALGTVAKYGLQLIAQIILARLLGPESYGLFAMGLLVLTLSNFVADFGFAWGLVQAENITDEDIRFAFTWQLIFGSIAAISLNLLAPLIANFFNESRLEIIIQWMSIVCIVSAIAAPSNNLLRRNMDFRMINIIQVVSYVAGYLVVGIPLAFFGGGVWSLVAAWLTQAFIGLFFSIVRRPHSIKPLFWYERAFASSGIGVTVFITNICNWILNNMDRIFIGRYLNAHAVGLYSVGYNFANLPNTFFLGAMQPAFLSAGARMQTEPERLRGAYLSVISLIWILITPMFVLFSIVAENLVSVLYGPEWVSSGNVLAILALAMPAYITWGMSTPILWNTNQKHLESLLQMPIAFIAAIAFFFLVKSGINVIAILVSTTLILRTLVIMTTACIQLKIRLSELFPIAIRGILSSAILAAGAYAGLLVGQELNQSIGELIGGIFCGITILVAAVFIYPQLLGEKVIELLMRFSPAFIKPLVIYLTTRVNKKQS